MLEQVFKAIKTISIVIDILNLWKKIIELLLLIIIFCCNFFKIYNMRTHCLVTMFIWFTTCAQKAKKRNIKWLHMHLSFDI